MKRSTTNSFSEGMIKDLNPLSTPATVLTDNLNGTLITYDGNELVLQNDQGNCKVELAKLPEGFIPVGVKEYGGIIYIASLNTQTDECEIGCFPSPERDFTTKDFTVNPIVFNSSDFDLENDKTTIILNLFEQELFNLHPGDLYVVTYKLDPTKDINTQAEFDQYISKDVLNKKLFRLKYYKISDEGDISELPAIDFNVVPEGTDLSNAYTYFKENSAGTLAVGLELEQLSYFEANVIDTSLPSNSDKKVTIEAVGFSDSMATFDGIKLDVELPEVGTYYIDKVSGNKITAKVSELIANSTFKASITPYSQYMLYPRLTKDFQIELGKFNDPSSTGINDIFRFKVEDNYVKIDFDFKFAGDSENGLHMYVELYDPWSNYSIVKTVDSPTYYGINQLIIPLIDEPTNHTFNPLKDVSGNIIQTGQQGGTPNNLLINNQDALEKVLLTTTFAVRVREELRRNHFYIVRISGAEPKLDDDLNPILDGSGNPVYKYYDFYKALYTNTRFNSIYDVQNIINENDPLFYKDFTKIPYDINSIGYAVTMDTGTSTITPGALSFDANPLITNGDLYKLSDTSISTLTPYIRRRAVSAEKRYTLTTNLKGREQLFGDFKTEISQLLYPSSVTPTIVESTPVDSDMVTNTTATTTIQPLANEIYNLVTNVTTNRTEKASIKSESKEITTYITYPVLDTIHMHDPITQNPLGTQNFRAVVKIRKYNLDIIDKNGAVQSIELTGDGVDDNLVDQFMTNNNMIGKSGYITTIPDQTMWYDPDEYHSCRTMDVPWKQFSLMFRTSTGNYRIAQIHDWETTFAAFTDLRFVSRTNAVKYVYTGNPNNIISNVTLKTTIVNPKINFTTRLTPSAPGVRTYLSKIEFRAKTNVPVDFSAVLINDYIQERKSDSIIIDSDDAIEPTFIPSIINIVDSVESVEIPNFIVSMDNVTDLKDLVLQGQAKADELTKPVNEPGEHGQLISQSLNNEYAKYISKFVVRGVLPGIPVDINTVYIEATDPTFIDGKWAQVNRCDEDFDAPNMLTGYKINRTT